MYLKNIATWKDLIYQSNIGQMGLAHLDLWDFYFDGSYDDAGVGCHLDGHDYRGSEQGRLTHIVGAALVHPHPRFHRTWR